MEYRQFNFRIKDTEARQAENEGHFSGIANAFNVIDDYGSTFDRGSFKKTLSEQSYLPAVWFHKPDTPIGSIVDAEETDAGLKVNDGKINLDTNRGREIYSGMQFDPPYITEMSIGFDTIKSQDDDEGIEHKKEVKLYEISPLTKNFAANPGAQIQEVRSTIKGIRKINQSLKSESEQNLIEATQELRNLLSQLNGEPIKSPIEQRPYEGEHACRLRDPGDFEDDSFRRVNGDRESNGKSIDVIYGKLEDEDSMAEQAYRYPDDEWSVSQAEDHCEEHDGIEFEPSENEEESIDEALEEARNLLEDGIARLDGGSRETTSESGSPQGSRDAGVDPRLVEEIKRAATELN